MSPSDPPPNLLTIPSELRNAIYTLVFDPSVTQSCSDKELHLECEDTKNGRKDSVTGESQKSPVSMDWSIPSHRLAPLRTCRQIHDEAHLMALGFTTFHVRDESSIPDCFTQRCSAMRPSKLSAIRHITLTARISQLRAMNEEWAGRPFGHDKMKLETLEIIPRRPPIAGSYAEISALSQCHTLAHVFGETFKTLRNIRVLTVKNEGCFNDETWRIAYSSIIFRMWRWGGGECGMRFECSPPDDSTNAWFKVYFGGRKDSTDQQGFEVGEEAVRLAKEGGELPDPVAGLMP